MKYHSDRQLTYLWPAAVVLMFACPAMDKLVIQHGRKFVLHGRCAALFSATRRLHLNGDPTQPALDTTSPGKGSKTVFDPELTATKSLHFPNGGKTQLSVLGSRLHLCGQPAIQSSQHRSPVAPGCRKKHESPSALLQHPGACCWGTTKSKVTDSIQEERVTSHIGSARLEQRLSDEWEVRLLARYGTRTYNEAFAQRDTTFWTIGPHVVWHFMERLALVVGYHYERGLADGRNEPQLQDDTSYINHYATIGMQPNPTERLSIEVGLHYERNNWTSSIPGDERNGGHEDVFQGEAAFRYLFTEQVERRRVSNVRSDGKVSSMRSCTTRTSLPECSISSDMSICSIIEDRTTLKLLTLRRTDGSSKEGTCSCS